MDVTSSTALEPKTITTLSRKEKLQAMQKSSSSENGSAVQESLATFRRVPRPEKLRRARRRRTHVKKLPKDVNNECNGGGDNQEGEKTHEFEKKIMALQQIVPGGGEELGVDELFEKTARYILGLQFEVKALRVLIDFVEGSDITKKLGG